MHAETHAIIILTKISKCDARAAAAWPGLSWQEVSMLAVLTHNGAFFSSAYFMAPKVIVTAAKNGENCKGKATDSVRIRKGFRKQRKVHAHDGCQAVD